MRTNIHIMAGGKSKPKHMGDERMLTEFDGVPLIGRTIAQFSPFVRVYVHTDAHQIAEVARSGGATVVPAEDYRAEYYGASMIYEGLEDFQPLTRHIILFGDVYLSEEAVKTILMGTDKQWAVYGRSRPSRFTRHNWGEYFAIEFNDISAVLAGLKAVEMAAEYKRSGQWHSCTPWEWYYEMEGLHYFVDDPKYPHVGEHWVEIDDITDDIDFAVDVEPLMEAVNNENR